MLSERASFGNCALSNFSKLKYNSCRYDTLSDYVYTEPLRDRIRKNRKLKIKRNNVASLIHTYYTIPSLTESIDTNIVSRA